MKKLLNFIVLIGISLLFVSCESKNSIPKELLGTYIQDGIEANYNGKENILDYYKHDGTAKLEKKGNRYYLEINTKYIIDKEIVRTFELKANGKVKEIKYQEFPDVMSVVGKYSKDIYYVTFTDVEVSGKDGDTFKYSPKIILVKERKLKTKEEDSTDYLSFFSTLQPEKNPVSILWINGKEFKKIKK